MFMSLCCGVLLVFMSPVMFFSILLCALIAEALRQDAEFISLEVRPSNRAAVALYTKLGFLEEGRRRNFYTDPTEDALILTRRFRKGD